MQHLLSIALMLVIACHSPEPGITADLPDTAENTAQIESLEPSEPVAEVTPDEVPDMTYLGSYRVTAYAYYEGGGENHATAGGYTPQPYYTCAAPYGIPMGTVLWIEGVGEVQVQDRGAFPDDWIDLLIGDDPMSSWDDRYREVYIVNYGGGQ